MKAIPFGSPPLFQLQNYPPTQMLYSLVVYIRRNFEPVASLHDASLRCDDELEFTVFKGKTVNINLFEEPEW